MTWLSDWCFGAWEGHPAFTFTVGGNSKTITAGSRYLYHPTAAISLVAQIEAKIQEEVPSGTVGFTRSGRVRIDGSSAINFAWGADTTLRDALGFTADFNTTSQVAPNRTRYLWRTGSTCSPQGAALDVIGGSSSDRVVHESATNVTSTMHNEWLQNDLEWTFVKNARYMTASSDQGEFHQFWKDVISPRRRFWVYRSVTEEETDTAAVLTGLVTLGPYKQMATSARESFPFNRYQVQTADIGHTVNIKVRTVAELT